MKLAIEIKEHLNGTYLACCPVLPGCKVLGLSREDARSKITQAVEGYLASLNVALPREIGRVLVAEAADSTAWQASAARPGETR